MNFWHRPVRARDLILILIAVGVIWSAFIACSFWFLRPYIGFRVDLRDQSLRLRLPENMPASGDINGLIPIDLKLKKAITLPIDQLVGMKIENKIPARVKVSTQVPVHTTISFEQTIPVSTELHMMVPVRSWLPMVPASLPISFDVPIKIKLPVDVMLPFELDKMAVASVPDAFNVPLKTLFKSNVNLSQRINAQVVSHAEFSLLAPLNAVPLRIDEASLNFSIADMGWEWLN